MATLSEQDKLLNADQQKQIRAYKDQWAAANAAGDQAAMDAAHKAAEAIRNNAGYSGGRDGSGVLLNNQTARVGGKSADEVEKWVQDYRAANLGANGWNNGYSTAMNLRSQANYIRQQMDANSKAWASADAATREYLHDQNVQLAKILEQYNGGAQSTYNEALGRWETDNANLGYGFNTGQYNDLDWYRNVYGMTDDQIKKYQNDTDRYYNFVDQRVVRNWQDESSGFTGEYAQFVNGPYAQLMNGTNGVPRSVYVNVQGDGFDDENENYEIPTDANGNIVPKAPALKNNNASDYTRALAAYTENGVILPGAKGRNSADKREDDLYLNMNGSGPNYATSMDDVEPWRPVTSAAGSGSASGAESGGSGLESYLKEMYAANLASQQAQLEAAYKQNLAELEESLQKSDAGYTEQKRQTAGTAAQEAANWREMANAMGLNSGAFGQAALAQSNQLQSNLNTLNNAQATAQADIEQTRALLGHQYQLAILEAQSNNDFELANALYNEAVRQDEALRQQEQFNAQLQLQYAQMAQSLLGTLISNSDGITLNGGLSAGNSAAPVYAAAPSAPAYTGAAENSADDVSDLFPVLRNTGSQINTTTDAQKRDDLANQTVETLRAMVNTGQLTMDQAKAWMDLYGI